MIELTDGRKLLLEEFNMIMNKAQSVAIYTRGIEFQKEQLDLLKKYHLWLTAAKAKFVEEESEDDANLIFCLEATTEAIMHELSMIVNLKEDNMSAAWDQLIPLCP